MKGISAMSGLTTLEGTNNATSLLGSGDGRTPSDSPDGRTTAKSGRDPALANLSPGLAEVLGLLTSGTSGPIGTTSLESANLSSFLVNRLQVRTQSLGSTLYKLTWKSWNMPSGRSRFRLRASVLRTSETERIGWPTPRASEAQHAGRQANTGHSGQVGLAEACSLAGWVTTTTRDWKDSGADIKPRADGTERFDQLPRQANLAGWATPNTMDVLPTRSPEAMERQYQTTRKGRTAPCNLREQVDPSQYPSSLPPLSPARLTDYGALLTGSYAGMESGGQLNPAHSRWLMGYPEEWDACAPTEMPSSRKSRQKS